ncbi:MAG: hypothetical protein AB7F39_06730 [Variibacter sp.]
MVRKTIDVEKLLHWAYRDELPKQGFSDERSGNMWNSLIALGTAVDTSHNADVYLPASFGPPSPDALYVDHAVNALDDMKISAHEVRHIAHPMADELPVKEIHIQSAALVITYAKMGTRPDWRLGRIRCGRVVGANGKAVVQRVTEKPETIRGEQVPAGTLVEGRTSARHYGLSARCPLAYEPSLQKLVFARVQYFAWRAALVLIAEKCAWMLEEFAPSRPAAAPYPWVVDLEQKSRILEAQPQLLEPA